VEKAIVQAVIEVPMARRQAVAAVKELPYFVTGSFGEFTAELTGHSNLRGLTFVELRLGVEERVDNVTLGDLVSSVMVQFLLSAGIAAQDGESEEFLLKWTEVFWEGQENEVLLVAVNQQLLAFLGGARAQVDQPPTLWSDFLSRFYDPAEHPVGAVKVTREPITF